MNKIQPMKVQRHGLELYCGARAISKAFKKGGAGLTYADICIHPNMDMCSDIGFLWAFKACMETVPAGFKWSGIVCTTWGA